LQLCYRLEEVLVNQVVRNIIRTAQCCLDQIESQLSGNL
jgi:hypothetical protein